ncbi:TMEM165/GDT1 family protein [Sphingosinicella sp. CPCC 101087]|uniref:TMEM165/GDT1 family protein n=1 Tax=Sphingosinicella sp. CPCC 101087 TaxID=2497754 RepID=UPI00101C562F|nr:TMEM165/GDT1 family protein [Sphingosinicella sp. CPCC 101087]
MDALVTAFVAASLAEWGDKSQLLVALLAARSGRPGLVLAGALAAAILSSAAAAFAGTLIGGTITIRAMSLLVALALLFAGVAGLVRRGPPALGSPRTPAILAAAILCLAAQMGDRTQFITFALSGRFDSPSLAAAGAIAGILGAAVPAALLGRSFATTVPIRAIRIVGAFLFLITGFVVALKALQLS